MAEALAMSIGTVTVLTVFPEDERGVSLRRPIVVLKQLVFHYAWPVVSSCCLNQKRHRREK